MFCVCITIIAMVTMKRVLTHERTKLELSSYLAKRVSEMSKSKTLNMGMACGTQCLGAKSD